MGTLDGWSEILWVLTFKKTLETSLSSNAFLIFATFSKILCYGFFSLFFLVRWLLNGPFLVFSNSIPFLRFINVYGCDVSGYSKGRSLEPVAVHKRDLANCNHPQAMGWLAVIYFYSFVVLGSQVPFRVFILLFFLAGNSIQSPNLSP
jgi:hypothetical protein